MDTRPINGTLYVESFNATGNPGEYSFENAIFANQVDSSGSGAFVVQVGFLLYVASADINTALPLPGILHRYKLTTVDVVDASTINGTMVWDELGAEANEIPLNGSTAGLSQPSPNYRYGFAPSEGVYPDLPAGFAVQTVQTDVNNITDQQQAGGGEGGTTTYKETIGDASALNFNIHHSLGTTDVSVTIFEISSGEDVFAKVTRTGPNDVRLDFTYPIDANSHRVLVRKF